MQLMFQYHVKFPWFNEKYNPAAPFVNLRLRVRREGWDGRIDKFVDSLLEGKFDNVIDSQEVARATLDQKTNDTKPSNGDKDPVVAEPSGETQDADMTNGNDEHTEEAKQDEGDGNEDSEGVAKGDSVVQNGVAKENGGPSKPAPVLGIDNKQEKFEEEEVTVEAEGNQVLIRTIPPDIGRVKLERVCRSTRTLCSYQLT